MIPVYFDSTLPEKSAKEKFNFPEFIMMENAAAALENTIVTLPDFSPESVILIICGNGNNGGDGYALARRLYKKCQVAILSLGEPKTSEAIQQKQMSQAIGIFTTDQTNIDYSAFTIIVDCIYGTGFHGPFTHEIASLLSKINNTSSAKIACDIPSGIDKNGQAEEHTFRADFTVTMGALKTALFSDAAKDLCGQIRVAELGISSTVFASCYNPDAYLCQMEDITLPFRNKKSAHKGTYGHTTVFAGQKSGAAILSASAAMNFGSGLTTLFKTEQSNLEQFKISPSLMISDSIPEKTTCVIIGNGLGTSTSNDLETFTKWFKSSKNPNCVIDADLFSYTKLPDLLEELNSVPDGKIVLTPHPKEFQNLINLLAINNRSDYSIKEAVENRITLGKVICKKFSNITLVLKSANTFIISGENCFICNSGTQALAKGGSGDILAGMIGGLLAQNYSAIDAAVTACQIHGEASKQSLLEEENFCLTPEQIIQIISSY